jgi:sigma-E factor negative regulatory protein RseA
MNEKLSALMDGELSRDEAKTVLKSLGSDENRRDCWDDWHLIGACMRGEIQHSETQRASSRSACTEAIFARLATEPTVLAPAAIKKPSLAESRTRMALAMAASVVTVSAVGVVALKQQQGGTVAPVQLVRQVAPQPVADASLQRVQAEGRVNDYLVIHRQFANPSAFQSAALNQGREAGSEPARQSAGR